MPQMENVLRGDAEGEARRFDADLGEATDVGASTANATVDIQRVVLKVLAICGETRKKAASQYLDCVRVFYWAVFALMAAHSAALNSEVGGFTLRSTLNWQILRAGKHFFSFTHDQRGDFFKSSKESPCFCCVGFPR